MCGIVGAIAQRNIVPILLEGLKRLEYRGYDSAGVAVVEQGLLRRNRSTGRVAELAEQCKREQLRGLLGIGHTRWATHGEPNERNAHPHVSQERIAVVHNGIIENHEALRQQLQAWGYRFTSDTDTEVIAHLIHHHRQHSPDLRSATQAAVQALEGAYAIGVVDVSEPEHLICARMGSPLLLGVGIEENFIASDVSALLPVTRTVIYLEDGDVAALSLLDIQVWNRQGLAVHRPSLQSELSAEVTELGQYRHFMQKEIHEQPKAVADTLEMLGHQRLSPHLFGSDAPQLLAGIERVLILACGTSYHAGVVARHWFETEAQLPTEVEVASEYRYRRPVTQPNTLVITISQSGETADTLAALKYAQSLGVAVSLTICNVPESALMRASQLRFLTRAGPEIGVASTKAFTTQLVALSLLSMVLAKLRGHLSVQREQEFLQQLLHLPVLVQQTLDCEPQLMAWAREIAECRHALFLGRGSSHAVAMEGALKLKEISYIHAEAYAAGELKHGPLALVDREMPVVVVAPNDHLIDKLKSNMQEVLARGGNLYAITEQGSAIEPGAHLQVLEIPASSAWLHPILLTIPTQLLAYHTALNKGTDVDKPRNLAKSVTVE